MEYQTNKNERQISFSVFSNSDDVEFYMDNRIVGRIDRATKVISRQGSMGEIQITMAYGRKLSKQGNLVLSSDGYDYHVFGGKPGLLVHKLYALPIDIFMEYLDSICKDINGSRLRRWIKMSKNDDCRIVINYYYFEFEYDDWNARSKGKDSAKTVTMKYSRSTRKALKKIPIPVQLWNKYGYGYCIQPLICMKLKEEYGYNIDSEGYITK